MSAALRRSRTSKEGDVLIHKVTNHAWANRSNETCRVLFVLVAAK